MHATLHVQASACTPWGNRASYSTQELKYSGGGKGGRRKEKDTKRRKGRKRKATEAAAGL